MISFSYSKIVEIKMKERLFREEVNLHKDKLKSVSKSWNEAFDQKDRKR